MIDRIVISGRLVEAPMLRYSQSGTPICGMTIANERRVKQEKETQFVPVKCFGKLAENCANNLDKGRSIAVDGQLWIRSYEANDGTKRKVAEILADRIDFLDWPKDKAAGAEDDLTGLDVDDLDI
jgi:single-strand DNA-binding protein